MTQLYNPDWRAVIEYGTEGPKPHVFVEDGKFKALVAGLEAGQKIPPHPEGVAMYHFLEGTGWMQVGDQRFEIKPGATVIAPAGAARGMEATTRLAFIAARMGG